MTVLNFKNLATAGLATALIGLAAVPAMAVTQSQIAECKAYVVTSGEVNLATHTLDFKTATNRKIMLEATPVDGGDSFVVTCKLKRGKIVTD
ncbi:hypothetical protein [Robiginitomaculum antarcticum]|uniref:hypothetical protein n=1 Tax=Robiginitomaculum antarcticum TaxID=437507 RepID=UPI00036E42BA|nr:hypothetical protein [Robiginitomaculum antarcticum]